MSDFAYLVSPIYRQTDTPTHDTSPNRYDVTITVQNTDTNTDTDSTDNSTSDSHNNNNMDRLKTSTLGRLARSPFAKRKTKQHLSLRQSLSAASGDNSGDDRVKRKDKKRKSKKKHKGLSSKDITIINRFDLDGKGVEIVGSLEEIKQEHMQVQVRSGSSTLGGVRRIDSVSRHPKRNRSAAPPTSLHMSTLGEDEGTTPVDFDKTPVPQSVGRTLSAQDSQRGPALPAHVPYRSASLETGTNPRKPPRSPQLPPRSPQLPPRSFTPASSDEPHPLPQFSSTAPDILPKRRMSNTRRNIN